MKQPLEGIRVLDWGSFHAGPGGCAILGDMGADVIKIERPEVGDPMRHQMRYGSITFDLPHNRNLFFVAANRNKKSITLNLKHEKGREIAYKLVARSDVFFTNWRDNLVEGMKMTYPILSQINPRLIYARVSAYGPNGPDSNRGGFDFQGQARSGFMFSMGEPDMPPLVLHFGVIDQAASIMLSHALLTALFMRERFGNGQELHVSLLGSAMFLQYINVLNALLIKQDIPRHKRSTADPLRNYYQCQDGKWLCIGFPQHWEGRWPLMCEALGHPELVSDPRFDSREKRLANAEEMVVIMDGIFNSRPRDEWLSRMSQHDLITSPVNPLLDLDDDPQVRENDYIVDFNDPLFGDIRLPNYPVNFNQARVRTRSLSPTLGEHTAEVLQDLAGIKESELDLLKEEGVI